MSTKINARSPFYLESEAPTLAEGALTCELAGLANFSVASDGSITEPTLLNGTIIDREHESFAALNIGDSSVARTVDYTIKIPDKFSNSDDGTIICTASATQFPPDASCNPSTNTNMATFAGTISDITNLDTSAQTVSLGSFFTQQSGATFKEYTVTRIGSSAIDFSLSGTGVSQTLSFTTTSTGVSATFTVTASNNDDTCTTTSNSFTVTAAATGALGCTGDGGINLTGGSISQAGVINRPSYTAVADLYKVYVGAVDYTSTNYPANTSTSSRTVTLKMYFRVPSAYTNATPQGSTTLSEYLLCEKDVTQAGTTLPSIACGDERIRYSGFRIANTGDIVTGDASVTIDGISCDFFADTGTDNDTAFDKVTVNTSRNIRVTITVPSGFSNTGNNILCTITREQPAEFNPCAGLSGTFYISAGVTNSGGHCGLVYSALLAVSGSSALGQQVCLNNTPYNGGNRWYIATTAPTASAGGDINAPYKVVQISEFGIILSTAKVNCDTQASGSDVQIE